MQNPVIIGKFGAVFGVKGWIKVQSATNPIDNILNYQDWHIQTRDGWQPLELEQAKLQGNSIVAKIKDIDDRDIARQFTNKDIAIEHDQLPDTDDNEYYWSDLEGLTVKTTEGLSLGKIDHMTNTGANDIMVVVADKRRRLIPYIDQVVQAVDLDANEIIVDWDPEF